MLELSSFFSPCHRVDPWECYQDTWQTTCSVLEHHRDLMKVSDLLKVPGGGGGERLVLAGSDY